MQHRVSARGRDCLHPCQTAGMNGSAERGGRHKCISKGAEGRRNEPVWGGRVRPAGDWAPHGLGGAKHLSIPSGPW